MKEERRVIYPYKNHTLGYEHLYFKYFHDITMDASIEEFYEFYTWNTVYMSGEVWYK